MKIIISIFVLAGLLSSGQLMGCDVQISVHNTSGHRLPVKVWGPHSRRSILHDLKDGESFIYHATGSLFNCHGNYQLSDGSGGDYCNMSKTPMSEKSMDMPKDGKAYIYILKTTNSNYICTVKSYLAS